MQINVGNLTARRAISLDSNNHLLLEHLPAFTQFLIEAERFLSQPSVAQPLSRAFLRG